MSIQKIAVEGRKYGVAVRGVSSEERATAIAEKNTVKHPEGLWPFTEMVLDQIALIGCPVLMIEAHAPDDMEEPDHVWGELTPHLELSEGEYLRIDQEAGTFNAEFGQRGCSGNDSTWGEHYFLQPTAENAATVARAYCDHFTRRA